MVTGFKRSLNTLMTILHIKFLKNLLLLKDSLNVLIPIFLLQFITTLFKSILSFLEIWEIVAIIGVKILVFTVLVSSLSSNTHLFKYNFQIFPQLTIFYHQVKPKILQLYREHYFPLGKQLIPCITGLVVSILPGVDEQNEGLQKDVYSTLDQLSEVVTKKYFIGAIWMVFLFDFYHSS